MIRRIVGEGGHDEDQEGCEASREAHDDGGFGRGFVAVVGVELNQSMRDERELEIDVRKIKGCSSFL